MGYQSKTYSLSDEVVAAIEAARAQGETPNQFLKRVLLSYPVGEQGPEIARPEPFARELVVELDAE